MRIWRYQARGRCRLRGMEIHTDGSNPSRSATNLVSETTKELDLRRAGFARDFRPLSAVRFRDRRQRRFWAICGPSAPENLELLFQWCGSLPADNTRCKRRVMISTNCLVGQIS